MCVYTHVHTYISTYSQCWRCRGMWVPGAPWPATSSTFWVSSQSVEILHLKKKKNIDRGWGTPTETVHKHACVATIHKHVYTQSGDRWILKIHSSASPAYLMTSMPGRNQVSKQKWTVPEEWQWNCPLDSTRVCTHVHVHPYPHMPIHAYIYTHTHKDTHLWQTVFSQWMFTYWCSPHQ